MTGYINFKYKKYFVVIRNVFRFSRLMSHLLSIYPQQDDLRKDNLLYANITAGIVESNCLTAFIICY